MSRRVTIAFGVLWLATACTTQRQPVQSIPVYGEEETSFDGVPSGVVSAVRANMKNRMEESPEDHIPRIFKRLDRQDIHMGIPYEIYLIKAEALEGKLAPGFDGLQLSTYYVPIIDSSGKEYVTMYALPRENGEVHSSGCMLGAYGYAAFLKTQSCTGRRIVIRRVPRSGYPRAFKFVGCLGPEQTLESGRYWAIEDLGNRLDELDTKEYGWQQVFEKMTTYYQDIKERGLEWR